MDTSEFSFREFSFREFNKVQASIIPYITKDVNIVVSLPTATGKTAIAEAAFSYHLKTDEKAKCIYASPYRSLSAEKHRDWAGDKDYRRAGVVLNTGDHLANKADFMKGRLILLTTESFDSKTRSFAHVEWLSMVKCVVIDEAHLLGQKGRGDSLEVSLMRFTKKNPESRIILLSATMTNAADLAKWLKSLNGKETIKVKSDWRPAKIETRFFTFDPSESSEWEEKLRVAVERAQDVLTGEKTIMFVHSKRTGKQLCQEMKKKGIRCAFHNAGLSKTQREKIERAFDDPLSGLDILVSTSTLSTGVNIG